MFFPCFRGIWKFSGDCIGLLGRNTNNACILLKKIRDSEVATGPYSALGVVIAMCSVSADKLAGLQVCVCRLLRKDILLHK